MKKKPNNHWKQNIKKLPIEYQSANYFFFVSFERFPTMSAHLHRCHSSHSTPFSAIQHHYWTWVTANRKDQFWICTQMRHALYITIAYSRSVTAFFFSWTMIFICLCETVSFSRYPMLLLPANATLFSAFALWLDCSKLCVNSWVRRICSRAQPSYR